MDKYIQKLTNTRIGTNIFIHGRPLKVRGKFQDRYIPDDGIVGDAYVLALAGRKELGLELIENERYCWFSDFLGTYSIKRLDNRLSLLKDVETGRVERIHSEGEGCDYYERYASGTEAMNGKIVFLGIRRNNFDVWTPDLITEDDIMETVTPEIIKEMVVKQLGVSVAHCHSVEIDYTPPLIGLRMENKSRHMLKSLDRNGSVQLLNLIYWEWPTFYEQLLKRQKQL